MWYIWKLYPTINVSFIEGEYIHFIYNDHQENISSNYFRIFGWLSQFSHFSLKLNYSWHTMSDPLEILRIDIYNWEKKLLLKFMVTFFSLTLLRNLCYQITIKQYSKLSNFTTRQFKYKFDQEWFPTIMSVFWFFTIYYINMAHLKDISDIKYKIFWRRTVF